MRDELVMRIPGIQAYSLLPQIGKYGLFLFKPPVPSPRGSGHLPHITTKPHSHWPAPFFPLVITKARIKYFYYMPTHSLSTCVYRNTVVLNLKLQWTLLRLH